MHISFSDLEKIETYRLLTHAVTPRPIAWVLTENTNGTFNIAPYSYFNVICSDPALMMISAGHKRDGSKKDTWENLERTQNCVIHIANSALIDDVNESARPLPEGESEVNALSATLISDGNFSLPRIEQAPIAFECQLHQLHLIGNGPQAVIYLEAKKGYLAESLNISSDFTFDEKQLDALARLGGDNYSLLGDINTLKRPT